ncbi:MAG: sigma-54-dependent transcriptional regulator [Planctomycetota bacterium]|jgi:DNA-binding NtrC family response regulator
MPAQKTDIRILIVDDEEHVVTALGLLLERDYTVKGVGTAEAALACFKDFEPDIVLLDITLPGMNGMDCLEEIKRAWPDVEVVMVTATREVRTAVSALKLGAYDYIEKPFDENELRGVIRNIHDKLKLKRQVRSLGRELARPYVLKNIVGKSQAMKDVLNLARKACRSDLSVVISGESGTGKELIARAIHYNGLRKDGPFVPANCARFSGEIIESELFGHEKGAFTGATGVRRGVFERAHEGTLFLDEIDTMPPDTQSKLLRVVEEKRFTRVGGERRVEVDVRLISATNVDLREKASSGAFREDLYYRLSVIPIHIPPLRSRREDIPLLMEHFIQKHRASMHSPLVRFSDDAMSLLQSHAWRGNVRELENTVLLLMSVCEKRIAGVEDLELPVLSNAEPAPGGIREQRAHTDKEALLKALEDNGWNRGLASQQLGIHRNTLRKLMKRYGLEGR